jgi:DNA-binding response OmpR family regulator
MNIPKLASKVVIVEDDKALAEIYNTRLGLLGYECFVATEGIEALAVIEKVRPNLVLLDIMLPKLSGDAILKAMRSTEWGKNIPVMVISNLNEADAPPGIREQGIEAYLVKANLADGEIDLYVNNILGRDNQQASNQPVAATGQAIDPSPQVVSAPPEENAPTPTPDTKG